MNSLDREFKDLLQGFNIDDLNLLSGSVYGVWADFSLGYLNPAWFQFAQDNKGEASILSKWGLRRSILDCMSGDVEKFYKARFEECLDSHTIWGHEYECSSDTRYRRFHQIIYPLGQREGLLFVNSLLVERPQGRKVTGVPDESHYMNENKLISQCAHCRRVQHAQEAERWDWIPEWVKRCPENTSHTFCPACFGHFFPLTTTTDRQPNINRIV